MLTEAERRGIAELLGMMSDQDLQSLAQTVTSKQLVPVSKAEAISMIILHTNRPLELLERTKIKKELMFEYLHFKSVPIKSEAGKIEHALRVLKLWGSAEFASTLEEIVPGNNGNGESSSSARPPKVKPRNISDKTNMYCNVCDLTLATRILFLSHCSTVHDVKFKGKSGQPLVIPQDRERSPAASHHDPASGSPHSPARKRARMSDSMNTTSDNPRRVPVPCKFCGKVFSNLSNKERHERQSCKVRLMYF